jgi:hypothetical protein
MRRAFPLPASYPTDNEVTGWKPFFAGGSQQQTTIWRTFLVCRKLVYESVTPASSGGFFRVAGQESRPRAFLAGSWPPLGLGLLDNHRNGRRWASRRRVTDCSPSRSFLAILLEFRAADQF